MAEEKLVTSVTLEDKKWLKKQLENTDDTEFIETGNIGFDFAVSNGKGLPIGDSILLWAKPGCGKTTVIVDVCKRLIEKGKATNKPFKVLYVAVERSRELMATLGMNKYMLLKDGSGSGDFLYLPGGYCWRQIEKIYNIILEGKEELYKDVKVIVIDSINSIGSDQSQKNSVADGDYGTRARERANFYPKMLPKCKEKGITSIFISQLRKKQDVKTPFEDPTKAAVSTADLHYVDAIFKCTSSTNTTDASKAIVNTIYGKQKNTIKWIFKMDSTATDCKNRYFEGNITEILCEKKRGCLNYYSLCKLLEGNKLAKTAGGWWTINKELCESLNLPNGKLRKAELNKILHEHACELVEFLKKAGMYKVDINSEEVAMTEEDFTDEDEDGEE